MRPNVTSGYIQALESGEMFPAIFLELFFAAGPIRIWSGYQHQVLLQNTYTGVGSMLAVSTIEDGSSIQARGVTVSLSGIDPTLLPAVLSQFRVGLSATIYLGLFANESADDTGSGMLLSNTIVAWQGRTDQPTITVGADTATISLNLESALLDMNTPIPYRYTQQDQNLFYPGDLGFSWVNSIQSIPIYWNQLAASNGNP